MSHFSENSTPLGIKWTTVQCLESLNERIDPSIDVYVIRLPSLADHKHFDRSLDCFPETISNFASSLGTNVTLVIIGEIIDLIRVEAEMPEQVRYQHWIAVKRATPKRIDVHHLPNEHFGILIHTGYKQSLMHTKTRIRYTYCPVCDKTTKDYGGKKHTYHAEGTLLSDVWRDIACDLESDITPLIERLSDLFGIEEYKSLEVLDCSGITTKRRVQTALEFSTHHNSLPDLVADKIIQGDCIEKLKLLPDNSIDFIFADPPYNLRKQYVGYSDDLVVKEYFNWCDQWIAEVARILKPGCTFALLNIPLWSVRHFLFAETQLTFQNWIVWDALSFPVRLIMPAHYTILCFSKGVPRPLPGLIDEFGIKQPKTAAKPFDALEPLGDTYCLRSTCVDERVRKSINDRSQLTDLWTDIHRLKHNSRRVDHPCQLPPQLMYRLISIFTKQNECVLDCFNGAGTTTLAAHQLKRHYIGIEASADYCGVAEQRHNEISDGDDPFRKATRVLTAKNSPVARLPKQKYEVSKKTLQLEVKRLSQALGHIPNREEVRQHISYPIEYYDSYFASWGEVTAAARTTGMTEYRNSESDTNESEYQLKLFS